MAKWLKMSQRLLLLVVAFLWLGCKSDEEAVTEDSVPVNPPVKTDPYNKDKEEEEAIEGPIIPTDEEDDLEDQKEGEEGDEGQIQAPVCWSALPSDDSFSYGPDNTYRDEDTVYSIVDGLEYSMLWDGSVWVYAQDVWALVVEPTEKVLAALRSVK
jgi:hypothetical protein